MSNKKTAQSTITKSRIASSKWLQLLCAILTLALDVVVLLVLFVNTTEIKYIVCPILLLALDLVFIVKVLLSNYRFMYAIGGVLIHVACIVLACGGAFLASGVLGERVVFETIALIALPAVHLLQCIAALCNAWQAIRRSKPIRRIVALVMSALLMVGIGLYVNFLHVNGFFGQGAERTERTVVYMLDASGSYYIAVDVLDGNGNTVTIPAEFNGLPVKGVDCTLFGNDEISYMVFAGTADLEFLNTASLAHVNENLSLEVDKANVDEFRGEFYALAQENLQMLYVANHIKPIGLKEGDVYVIPRYDKDALELANGQILPTWFGSADDVLNVWEDVRFATCDYVLNSDVTDESQLYWCYVNQQAQVFRWLRDSEGKDLSNAAIHESTEVYVTFDRVYSINFGTGNDTLHTLDASYTGFNADGEYIGYKLATADRAADVIARIPTRNGFTLTWLAGPDRHNLTDLPAELQSLSRGESLNVYPEWKLEMPTIDSLTADGVSEGHSAVYGETVSLAAQATSPHESISLKYEWILNEVLGEEKNYTINNLHPQDATTYTLRVTAYADTTSLTATVEKTIDVGFEKRELHFDWAYPKDEDAVYSASNKPVSATGTDAINGDTVQARLSQDSVRDAGEYVITIELLGDTATKYKIAESDASQTVVVTPYPLSVSWSDERSFVYDGKEQYPEATVQPLGSDEVPLRYEGGRKNAGTDYRVTVTTNDPNYTLTKSETTFEITPRPISSISWNSTAEFVYNAGEQVRRINRLENCIEADREALLRSVIYSGGQVNVGDGYTVSVSLPEDGNYYFADNCNTQSTFTIKPRKLTIKMDNAKKEYDGKAYTGFSYTVIGLQGADRENEIFTNVQYVGDAVGVVNVGSQPYAFEATVDHTGAKAGNYTLEITEGTLTITKKPLTVVIDAKSKTYDGYTFPEYEFTFKPSGLVSADANDIKNILDLQYKGEALENTDAGEWMIDATVVPRDAEKFGNYDVRVTKGKLTIKKAPATVTAIILNNEKIYDGTCYDRSNFDFNVVGLVGGDQKPDLGDPMYSGSATNNPNAGTHTLSVRLDDNDVTKNYDFTYVTDEVVILRKAATVTALDGTKVYDGTTAYRTCVDFAVEGVIDADRGRIGSPHYYVDVTDENVIRNVGEYTLAVQLPTLEKTENYDITYEDGKLTVIPKLITVTLSKNLGKTYNAKPAGASDFEYSVNGLVGGDKKTDLGDPIYGGDAVGAVNAGTYDLTLELPGNPNYSIQLIESVHFTISKHTLTVSVNNLERIYDGTEGGEFSYTVNGLQGSDAEVDVLGEPIFTGPATTAKDAGNGYELYLSFTNTNPDNYTLNINNGRAAKLTIKKAKVQVAVDPIEKEYDGKPLADFTFSVKGLVAGETMDQLGEPQWFVWNANDRPVSEAKDAGTYSVQPKFAVHPNYEISVNGTTCRITKKTLTVTVDPIPDKTYDGEALTGLSFSVEGLVDGETVAQLGTPTWTANGRPVAQAINAGEYSVNVSFAAHTNYNFNVSGVTCEITKRPVTVSAIAPDRDYDGTTGGDFKFNMLGLAAGDSKNDFEATFGGSAMTAKDPGTYTLTVTIKDSAKARNYEFDYVSNDFVIREVETGPETEVGTDITTPPETQG